MFWPVLEKKIEKIEGLDSSEKLIPIRDEVDYLIEILELVRQLSRQPEPDFKTALSVLRAVLKKINNSILKMDEYESRGGDGLTLLEFQARAERQREALVEALQRLESVE